jgi:hypothetical protein
VARQNPPPLSLWGAPIPSLAAFPSKTIVLKMFAILIIFATSIAVALTPVIYGGSPHLQANVESRFFNFCQAIMLSSFPARFDALAASLNASYPPARFHLQGAYLLISQNCAQQGRSLVLLNNHFSSLCFLEGIQDLSQFNIPERITNISEEYLATFLLSNSARDEALSSLRTSMKTHPKSRMLSGRACVNQF